MSILLTGGTGKTSIRIARLLQNTNMRFILTSRQGIVPEPFTGVKFDWYDPATFENPFAIESNIESVYLVPPLGSPDVIKAMKPFIDLAVEKGVKRFVLLSISTLDAGSPYMGKVHEYLISLGVDYFVIRPSWFFGTSQSESVSSSLIIGQRTLSRYIWRALEIDTPLSLHRGMGRLDSFLRMISPTSRSMR